ncbi:LysR family transcriptional regulator [Streptomyces sp. NPDC127033]|uniref:LysR family transcriptional regulator n=1 Tax=Streptomyces sp. NPDC127033 TaxID=3347110 RepID=UPI0036545F74
MELRQLEYFIAVAEEASFTKAAARVHVAQPGVSAQIRRLERELGHELLDRTGRSVRLTDVGTAVLPYARAALAAVDGARLAVDELTGLMRGQVSIGTVSSITSLALPDLLATFHERHPGVDIALSEGNSDQLADAVRAGHLDVGVIGFSTDAPADVQLHVIADETLVGAVGHAHPLAGRVELPVEEARDERLICLPPGTGLRSSVEAAWAAVGATPRIAFEAGDPHVLAQLAARGLGMAVLPLPFARAHVRQLHTVSLIGTHLRARLALCWRSNGPMSPAARTFVGYARETLAGRSSGSGSI